MKSAWYLHAFAIPKVNSFAFHYSSTSTFLIGPRKVKEQKSFRAAGISHHSQESALSDDDDPFKTLAEGINNLRERAPELAQENVTAGIVECDDDGATFEADPLTVEDIIAEFNHSADANEEEEEEMDEDEIAIVDEPPKPPAL